MEDVSDSIIEDVSQEMSWALDCVYIPESVSQSSSS